MAQTAPAPPAAPDVAVPPAQPATSGDLGPRGPWLRRLPLLPALGFVVVVTQIPFLMTLYYSFQRWNLMRPANRGFAAFDNYAFVLGNATFRTAAINTGVMTAGAVLLSLGLGLGLALLLNRRFRGRAIARTLMITPFLIMPVASALMWKNMILHPTFGLFSVVMRPFVGTVDWVSQYPMTSVILAISWRWTPFFMLILLAGLQSQDTATLEAAEVDGANPLQTFRFLTLPHLRPYIELSVLLGSIFIVQTFDEVVMMTQGGPGTATTNLPYFIFLEAFRALDVGRAAAMAVVAVLVTILIATGALRVMSRAFQLEGGR